MKRILLLLATIYFTSQLFAQVNVNITDIVESRLNVDDTVSVWITVGDLTELGIISFQFNINYDSTVVNAVGINTSGDISFSDWIILPNIDKSDQIQVAGFGAFEITGSGNFIELLFVVVNPVGFTNLTSTEFLFNNGTPSANVSDGSITLIVNQPPELDSIPDQTIEEGDSFVTIPLDDHVEDPDNPDNQMSWTYSGNTELTVTIDTGRVATIGIPNINWNGSETITFKAMDPGGLADSNDATFTVTAVNDTPIIAGLPDNVIVYVDSTYILNVWVYVEDIETPDSLLTYQFFAVPDSIALDFNDSLGLLTIVPDSEFIGTADLIFIVTDPDSASATDTIVVIVDQPVSTDENIFNQIPKGFSLFYNYPNPFNPSTTIKYEIPESGVVTLTVYDIIGNKVKTLVDEFKDAGIHNIKFDASSLASGIYLYRLIANEYIMVKKMILLR